MTKGKEISNFRITHMRLSENIAHYPDGFIRLLKAFQTSEDLFRIATMSELYCDVALLEIDRREMNRDFQIWKYVQTKNQTDENYNRKHKQNDNTKARCIRNGNPRPDMGRKNRNRH